jgi:two-component system chemotaxis response regulator CheB
MKSWPPLRFRCQVGHAFTAEALAKEKDASYHEGLRVALRIIEERAVLLEKMIGDARRQNLRHVTVTYDRRLTECRSYTALLRSALTGPEAVEKEEIKSSAS